MTAMIPRSRAFLFAITLLLLAAGCRADVADSTPDYAVTVIPPAPTASATRTASPVPPSPEASATPTLDWGAVTLLPSRTPEAEPEASAEPSPEPPAGPMPAIPDPLTEANLDLLVSGKGPFTLSDAELSLGRVVLPVDLISLAREGPFSVRSIPVAGYPAWLFLAFSLPLPEAGELGAVVRAPIDGTVMAGTMIINNQRTSVVNIDHGLGDERLVRASLVYSGTIEPLFAWEQEVEAGDVLFRLTRDTGRLETLGDTIILGGANLTLYVAIDTISRLPSGDIEELKFLRWVSLTPGSFFKDRNGLIISPTN